jgi:hypothetical protein
VEVTPGVLHRPPAPPRIPRAATPLIVAHIRDGSSNASGRLAPRPSRALTSINAASNHDVTQHSDADAPRKQAFTHTTTLLQQLRYGQPLPGGSSIRPTPRPLTWLSAGNQRAQVNNAVHCHVGLQNAKTSPLGIR